MNEPPTDGTGWVMASAYQHMEARAEAAEEQYKNLLRAGEDQDAAFDECRDKLARVREWAGEPIPSGDDPYQKGIQHAKRVVLAVLDGEDKPAVGGKFSPNDY